MRYDRPPLMTASASRGWRVAFRVLYRLLRWLDPLLRLWWRLDLPPLGRSVLVVVTGRRSGRPRSVMLTLLVVEGVRYVGHPNGAAPWTRNVEAAGVVTLRDSRGVESSWRAMRLRPGAERDAVIRATWSQQPFPGT